ncbi:DUF456 domain-containing protein [Marispirochaeta sp.]|jgi:uncharacterized protein|uniref:DUF456 domain-containing protein n=1 Tax=Marispirochaeta sp. TaxID=2038653 RepID=UPI0029C81F09|nr:DUF456 domain-containing protein [Marispirochaeta sp.]
MILSILAVSIGSVLIIAGLIGCIVPVLPGPPIAFAALIIISLAGTFNLFPVWLLVLLGAAAVAAAVFDSLLPVAASRFSGAGKAGVRGSIVGMIIGTIFFPPFGTIIGTFLGALAGELIWRRPESRPFKAALGVFSGTMAAILIKLAVTGVIGFYFFRGAVLLF